MHTSRYVHTSTLLMVVSLASQRHWALRVFSSPSPPQDLQEHKLTLKGVLETHFHADFVSGHCELSQRTGATIYFGPGSAARTQFDIHELQDNEACVLVFISLCSGPINLCVAQLAVCRDKL